MRTPPITEGLVHGAMLKCVYTNNGAKTKVIVLKSLINT